MRDRWIMTNVVFYDGSNAYVSKFIIKADTDEPFRSILAESEIALEDYLSGNGEILKIDPLYTVNLDNIIALKDCDDAELKCAYDRFNEMYF